MPSQSRGMLCPLSPSGAVALAPGDAVPVFLRAGMSWQEVRAAGMVGAARSCCRCPQDSWCFLQAWCLCLGQEHKAQGGFQPSV